MVKRKSLFRKELTESKTKLYGRIILTQPLSYKLVCSVIFIIMLLIILFICFGRYATHETVPGILKPSAGIAHIHSSSAGYVDKIYVHNGQVVKKGEALFKINKAEHIKTKYGETRLQVHLKEIKERLYEQLVSVKALARLQQKSDKNKTRLLKQKKAMLGEQIKTSKVLLVDARQSYNRYKKLQSKGYGSLLDETRAKNNWLRSEEDLQTKQSQLKEAQIALEVLLEKNQEIPQKLASHIKSLEYTYTKAKKAILDKSYDHHYTVRAHIAGKVSTIIITRGDYIKADRLLAVIIPLHVNLVGELYVPAKTVGFLQIGTNVNLEFEAFPYQWFGVYHGKVVHIDRTLLSPKQIISPVKLTESVYRVRVALDKQTITVKGSRLHLQPQMPLKATLIFNSRRIISWILDPVLSLRGNT